MIDGADLARQEWESGVLALYPRLAGIIAALGSPELRWFIDPTLTTDNAHFIARTKISFPNGILHEQLYLEVQMRDQSYADPALVRYLTWHESGHALAYLMSAHGSYRSVYEVYGRYLAARGLPPDVVTVGPWSSLTQERFADDFWASHDPSYDPTNGPQPAAGPMTNSMRPFFEGLVRGYDAGVIPDPAGYLLRYPVTSPFGPRPPLPNHTGIDLGLPNGTLVPSVRGGQVTHAGYDSVSGNSVIVQCPEGDRWWFAHLSRIDVVLWSQVTAGTVLGLSGDTGTATGPHLHLEWDVWEHGTWIPVDPSEEVEMLSQETQAQIRAIVADEVAKGAFGVATSVASGFNETLPRELRAIQRGYDPLSPGANNGVPIAAGETINPSVAK